MLIDQYNRKASYLRIGVTDRCNLRCRYCMPEEGIDFANRDDLLTYEEMLRLARIFRTLGVDKVRLTGGEPFVRKGIDFLLTELSEIFPSVHVTSNATLLHEYMDYLKKIKISGINISIDSLDRNKFQLITRRDAFEKVQSNIFTCLKEELPVKLNVVLMKGVNDDELLDFVQFGIDNNVEVRFIEAMPFNQDDGNRDVFISAQVIEDRIRQAFPSFQREEANGSASDLYLIDGKYKIGIIPAYTRSLCASCNRIRLTPKGELLTCLYAQKGVDLLDLIRNEKYSDEMLTKAIKSSIYKKLKSGFEEEAKIKTNAFRSMTTIGG